MISHDISMLIDDLVLRGLVFRAPYTLLENQYVLAKSLPTPYKCILGSGIGLTHSAVVASLLFYARVESKLVPQGSGLTSWIRYHDDCLAVFRARESGKAFFGKLKDLAEPVFIVTCESVNSVGKTFTYLDLDIHVTVPNLTCNAAQHKVVIPLCPSSAHTSSVHRSWPGAVCNRVYTLSDEKTKALQTWQQRYIAANAHPNIVAMIRSWEPKTKPAKLSLSIEYASNATFVLRYHPSFKQAFSRALHIVPVPKELRLKVMPAWKNSMPSLCGIVDKTNRVLCSRDNEMREGTMCVSTQSLHKYTLGILLKSS